MLLREQIKTPLSSNRLKPRQEKNPTPFIYNVPEPGARKAERYRLLWLTGKQKFCKNTRFPDFSIFCITLPVWTGNKV